MCLNVSRDQNVWCMHSHYIWSGRRITNTSYFSHQGCKQNLRVLVFWTWHQHLLGLAAWLDYLQINHAVIYILKNDPESESHTHSVLGRPLWGRSFPCKKKYIRRMTDQLKEDEELLRLEWQIVYSQHRIFYSVTERNRQSSHSVEKLMEINTCGRCR